MMSDPTHAIVPHGLFSHVPPPESGFASINQDCRLALDRIRHGARRASHFHIPLCLLLEGSLQLDSLERALNAIIQRHDALRSAFSPAMPLVALQRAIIEKFSSHDGWKRALFTQSARNVGITLRVVDGAECGAGVIITPRLRDLIQDEMVRPFALDVAPPIRATVYRRSDSVHLLLVIVHHLVADGWSMRVFLEELRRFYRTFAEEAGEPPHELSCSFRDHARLQRTALESAAAASKLAVWQRRYESWAQHGLTLSDLPFLQRHASRGADRSGLQTVSVGSALSQGIQRFCRDHRVTLYMLTMAALFVVCHLHSRKERVTFWGVLANRTPDTEPLIGWFSEGRIIGIEATSGQSFDTLLATARQLTLELNADQYLPLAAIQHPTLRRPDRTLFGPDAVHLTTEVASRGVGERVQLSASLYCVPLRVAYNHSLSGTAVRLRVEPGQAMRLRGFYAKERLSGRGVHCLLRQLRDVMGQAIAEPQRSLVSFAGVLR